MDEAEIIEKAKLDRKHFGILYDKYFTLIFRFVFKRLGCDEQTTGDVTQQTFLKAMLNIDKYTDRGLPFSSWLYRIAHNEVNLHFRDVKKKKEIGIDASDLHNLKNESSEENIPISKSNEELIKAINNLDLENSNLIELRFFLKMSFKEIADIYNISEASCKMKTYRILEKMNKNWGK